MEHGAQAAKTFVTLIKETAPRENQPGRKRSLVIGTAGAKNVPVLLVSPKKPSKALTDLSTMSQKLGKVTPLAVGQVVFEGNVVHVKALKNANETKVKTTFLEYYKTYKISPPSQQVKLWQPQDWEAVEFDEDPNDTGGLDAEADEGGEGSDAGANGTASETATESGEGDDRLADYRVRIAAAVEQFKKFQAIVGATPQAQPFLKSAEGKIREAHGKYQAADFVAMEAALESVKQLLLAAGRAHQGQSTSGQSTLPPKAPPDGRGAQWSSAQPQGPSPAAVAQVNTLVQQAKAVQQNTPALKSLRQRLDADWLKLTTAMNAKDWATAHAALDTTAAAARQLLLRQQLDVSVRQKQSSEQKAQYDEMAPVLGEVTRTYFNGNAAAGSARLKKEDLKAGTHFKAYLAALEALEKLKATAGANPNAQQQAALKQAADTVAKTAQDHLDHFEKDLSKSDKKDKVALRKKQICGEALKAVRHYSMALELQGIGAPSTAQPWSQEQQVKVNGLRAQFAFETGYKKASDLRAAGGQSEAYWVESEPPGSKKPTKSFIFKPMDGETGTLRQEKGAGAAKEAIASAKAKLFEQQTGIDLGVPETSVATIGSYAIDGADEASGAKIGSIQQFARTDGALSDQGPGVLGRIPAAECHRMALNDIMSLNVDRHPGNFLVQKAGGPNGSPKLVPIDHGCTLPTMKDFKRMGADFGGLRDEGVASQNILLSMPGAYEKLSQDMQDRIALMDPDAIAAGTKDHLGALDKANPGLGASKKVPQDSIDLSTRVLKFLKKAAPTLSPAEIQIAIAQHRDEFADPNQDIEQIADAIIQDAAPKGPGYAEYFALSFDQRDKMVKRLVANKWIANIGAAAAFIMADPVAALKLYKGNVVKGQADAPTAARGVDMRAALTSSAQDLLTDIANLFPDADQAKVASFRQRHQQLTAQAPADDAQAKSREDQAKKLYDEVLNSALGVIAVPGKKLYDDNIERFANDNPDRKTFSQAYNDGFSRAVSAQPSIKDARNYLDYMQQIIAKLGPAQ